MRAMRLVAACLLCFGLAGAAAFADEPSKSLPCSAPEAQGVDSTQLLAFLEAANRQIDTLHSVIVVRHGQVVAEGGWRPEGADKRHVLHSLSKSFTSTAVGFAVAEGKRS